mmetsp:Transcript_7304/g.11111  ORF Transcript_7304/g.11111 Transcript_7304/m.11111 type:complete len:958 (+) Transcript_7304:37-2910(+)
MSWFPQQETDPAKLQAEINGLKAYKINADAAIRKLKVSQKRLHDRVKLQEKQLEKAHLQLNGAARKIQNLSKEVGVSQDVSLKNDFKRILDENVSLKRRLEDAKEEYRTRTRALEANIASLSEERKNKFFTGDQKEVKDSGNRQPSENNVKAELAYEKQLRQKSEEKYERLQEDFKRLLKKMEEHDEIRIKLRDTVETRDIEKAKLQHQISDLKQHLESKNEREDEQGNASLEEKIRILEAQKKELEAGGAGDRYRAEKKKSDTYQHKLAHAQDQLLKLRNAYHASQAQLGEFKRILVEKDRIIDSMAQNNSKNELSDKLSALSQKTAKLSNSLAQAQSESIELRSSLEEKTQLSQILKISEERLKRKLDMINKSLEDTKKSHKEQIMEKESQIDGLRNEGKKLQEDLSKSNEKCEELKSKLEESTTSFSTNKKALDVAKRKLKDVQKLTKSMKKDLEKANKVKSELKKEAIKNDQLITDLKMQAKIEQKKTVQLTKDLKKALKKDALKATEVKANLALEVDKRQALEANLQSATNKIKSLQKRLLLQPLLQGHQDSQKDLSTHAKGLLQGVSTLVENTLRKLLEMENGSLPAGGYGVLVSKALGDVKEEKSNEETKQGKATSTDSPPVATLPVPTPPPVPPGPKPNTPQAEFVEAIAAKYEESLSKEHGYQEKVKYLQDTVRMLNQDCEKKRAIIQAFLLENARDPDENFVSRFANTPEQFRELLLTRMEVVLQDAIVQNIRLRDQVSDLITNNSHLRQNEKKALNTIERCRHVILKLRKKKIGGKPADSTVEENANEDGKKMEQQENDDGPQLLDAADALEVAPLIPEDNKKDNSKTVVDKTEEIQFLEVAEAPLPDSKKREPQPAHPHSKKTVISASSEDPPIASIVPPTTTSSITASVSPSVLPAPIPPPTAVLSVQQREIKRSMSPLRSATPVMVEADDDDGPEVANIPLPG